MKILYYNWVDYLDDENRGGGVSVYQRNLVRALAGHSDVSVAFFSSGVAYDLLSRVPRWDVVDQGDACPRYEIVNSGVIAPAHHSYGDGAQLDHPETAEAVYDLIDQTGPYDVLHLNNLEGLPVSVLEGFKTRWPQMRIVVSLHNYYPFCPQVNFWHQERISCTGFDEGRNCVHCLPARHNQRNLQLAAGLSCQLKSMGLKPGSWAFDVALFWSLRLGAKTALLARRLRGVPRRMRRPSLGSTPGTLEVVARPDGTPFANRRAQMVAALNGFCDSVLCVSDAVRTLAVAHGIDPKLAHTSYIGSPESARFAQTVPRAVPQSGDGVLTLGYLGYMRRDKGFYFLLQALETLPPDLAGRVRVVIAARRGDKATMGRVAALGSHLSEVDYANGYGHDDLDRLLAQVDVGLVPVLWHDNLPQVALEMHARHIPLLCADMGGAQELGNCPEMVFPAGNIEAFHARIAALLDGTVDFDRYWQGARPPTGMPAHIDGLLPHYRG